MEQQDFLTAVLPSEGRYCTLTLADNFKKQIFDDSLDGLYRTNMRMDAAGYSAYFALATFDDSGRRKAENARSIKTLSIDLDCGTDPKTGKQKAFPSKRAAVTALHTFMGQTGLDKLGTPWMIDSGGGVHVHWPLDAAVDIDTWAPVAARLKTAAAELAFPLDSNVTGDAARVLRIPGTHNYKFDPPRPVVLKLRGDTFRLEDLAQTLAPFSAAPPMRPSRALATLGERPSFLPTTIVGKALLSGSTTSFKKLLQRSLRGEGCAQVQHYVTHAADDGMEPLWRGMLSLAKVCEDGLHAARKISALHPYDEGRMLQKWNDIRGPYTCTALNDVNPGVCKTCPNYCKVNTPLSLCRVMADAPPEPVADTTPAMHEDMEYVPPKHKRPQLPASFRYAADGSIWHREQMGDEQIDTLVVPYPLYLLHIFREDDTYRAEFMAEKAERTITFGLQTSMLSEAKNTLKALAGVNIFPGAGAAQKLFYLVKSMVDEHSHAGREVDVPDTMGWQPNGAFVVGDEVLMPDGSGYRFRSTRLDNLIACCTTKGTLEGGLEPLRILINKAKRDVMYVGHVAAITDSLASPLAHFSPAAEASSTLHVCGPSTGAGKTLIQYISASFWGEPSTYTLTARTSETTTMQRAEKLNGLPLIIEELTSVQRETKGEHIPRLAFAFADGKHKARGLQSGGGEIRQRTGWRGYMQATSNTPSLEYMAGVREGTSEGEMQRLLEWRIPRNWSITWEDDERGRIAHYTRNNWGVVGRKWVQFLMQNAEEVSKVRAQVEDVWIAAARPTDTERFWTSHIVNNLTAAVLCGVGSATAGPRARFFSMPMQLLLDFWCQQLKEWRSVISGGRRSALDLFNTFMQENNGRMVISTPGSVIQGVFKALPLHGDVKGRVEHLDIGVVRHHIPERVMRSFCALHNYSYDAFKYEMATKFAVSTHTVNLNKGTGGPNIMARCISIDMPKHAA